MFPPACATVAGAVFATDTSELAATPGCVVVVVALSLPASSLGVPVIAAVFVNEIGRAAGREGVETTMVIVAVLAQAVSVPRLQVTVAVPRQVPCDGVEDTNVVPAGSVSVTDTSVACVLPVCEAVIA